MSLTLGNNIAETTTTTGTGDYLLAGVVSSGYRPFGDVGNGGLTLYKIENADKTKSEWGVGTYNSGSNTLARTTILGNYLGTTAAINWTSGTKNIYSPPLVELLNWITFSNSATISALKLAESSAPSTPASGFASLYVKTDGKLYLKDDAGTETDLTAGSTFDSLSDVVITSPATGHVIRYNGSNWVNATLSTAAIQPLDATLTAFAGLTIAANTLTIGTGTDAFSQTTFGANTFPARASSGDLVAKTITDFGLSLVDDSNASAARTTIGVVIGTDVQAYHARLADIAGASWAQGDVIYHDGSNLVRLAAGTNGQFLKTQGTGANPTWATLAGGGDLLSTNNLSDVSSAGTSRTNLGIGTGDSPQFTAVNLGHASDTTLTRVSAGVVAIEGVNVVTTSSTDTLTNKTLSSAVLSGSNQVTGRVYTDLDALTDGSTITIDFTTGNKFTVTLGGNRTIAFSNTVAGQVIAIRLKQDGTGSRTITWPGGINWAGGSAPTLTTTANKSDWIAITVVTAGSEYDGAVLSQNH